MVFGRRFLGSPLVLTGFGNVIELSPKTYYFSGYFSKALNDLMRVSFSSKTLKIWATFFNMELWVNTSRVLGFVEASSIDIDVAIWNIVLKKEQVKFVL